MENSTLSGGKILCLLPLQMVCPCNLLFSFSMKDYHAGLFSFIFESCRIYYYVHTYILTLFLCRKEYILFASYHSISAKSRAFIFICLIIETLLSEVNTKFILNTNYALYEMKTNPLTTSMLLR